MAVCGIPSIGSLDAGHLLALVEKCYDLAHADAKQTGMSNVRRAACRMDELLYADL
jgi:glycerol-3-phosphate acyltransferase PlsY